MGDRRKLLDTGYSSGEAEKLRAEWLARVAASGAHRVTVEIRHAPRSPFWFVDAVVHLDADGGDASTT